MDIARKQLAELIAAAAEAHHEYEATLEEPDQAWPEWYADYILRALESDNGGAKADVRSTKHG